MKKQIAITLLAALLLWPTGAIAQREREGREHPREEVERDLMFRERQLELEAREMDLDMQRQMQELELDERRADIQRRQAMGHGQKGGAPVFLAICAVVNILLTVWVYQDIRKRNAGSGLWIPITLLSGFFGALLYAVVRLGDQRQQST